MNFRDATMFLQFLTLGRTKTVGLTLKLVEFVFL